MMDSYYQTELQRLRERSREFAADHPLLAPMLSGPHADPDVEYLLEGVAFLTSHIHRKLDQDLPELLQTLVGVICPQYLRPQPAATIIEFTPKPTLKGRLAVPAGTYIDSEPIDGIPCRFRTCSTVELLPLELMEAQVIDETSSSRDPNQLEIRLAFEARVPLAELGFSSLRLHLAGDFAEACNRYFLLKHHLDHVEVAATGSPPTVLGPDRVAPGGFREQEALVPYPGNVFPAFRVLHEYFLFPERFLFLDLDLREWQARGMGYTVRVSFFCSVPSFQPPRIRREHFRLFAAPAVNLFEHEAAPFVLKHREPEIPLRAAEMPPGSFQIFSVDAVTGRSQGEPHARAFAPFAGFQNTAGEVPVYHTLHRSSDREGHTDLFLSVAYPPGASVPESEVISARMTCTNACLTDMLQAGDIRLPTSNSPELATFANISAPSTSQPPPAAGDLLPYLVSHLSTNYQSIARLDRLKSLLRSYLVPGGSRDKPREIANERRMNGLLALKAEPEERVIDRSVYRGLSIRITARHDHFVSPGDLYLFGSILDYFFGNYVGVNSFTSLTVESKLTGEYIQWPARLGTRPLL